jgi:hypothetical protein
MMRTTCNERSGGETVPPMAVTVSSAPVRNLAWVAARFGHR